MEMDRQKMKVKICLVGEGAVGKTCLIRRFIQDQFDDRYISTLGAKVSKKEIKIDGPTGGSAYRTSTWGNVLGEKLLATLQAGQFQLGPADSPPLDTTRRLKPSAFGPCVRAGGRGPRKR